MCTDDAKSSKVMYSMLYAATVEWKKPKPGSKFQIATRNKIFARDYFRSNSYL